MSFKIPNKWNREAIVRMTAARCANTFGRCDYELEWHNAKYDFHHLRKHCESLSQLKVKAKLYSKRSVPLAYLLGSQPFCGLSIRTKRPVLIPRPETEMWVEEIVKSLDLNGKRILDVGSGSGCIALAIAKAFPHSQVVSIDPCVHAFKLSAWNQKNLSIPNASFINCCLSNHVPSIPYDMIVSNPPYIPFYRKLPISVKRYESREALYSGEDGMDMIRQLLQYSKFYSSGKLVIEIGSGRQGRYLNEAMDHVSIKKDFFNRPRSAWINV